MVGLEPHLKYLRGRSLCHMDKMELPLPLWGHSQQPLTCTAVQACLPGVRCTEGERGEGPRSLPLSLKARRIPTSRSSGAHPSPTRSRKQSLFREPVSRSPTYAAAGRRQVTGRRGSGGLSVDLVLAAALSAQVPPPAAALLHPTPSSPPPPRCGSGGCLSSPATRHAAPPRPPSKGFGNSIP